MAKAFIIMQIGEPDLDKVCDIAIIPALKECGLEPKRVDKHNQGGLLKSEIVGFIESSEIIVADLTNERPNCYLEVGYAMGVDKLRNLILTAREDHLPGHPSHSPGGPKVHFDLAGYDILFWRQEALEGFRSELEKRIRRRQLLLTSSLSLQATAGLQSDWFNKNASAAQQGLARYEKQGFMQLKLALRNSMLNLSQHELLDAASQSQIRTFGWPIGAVMTSGGESPRPVCEILHRLTIPRTTTGHLDEMGTFTCYEICLKIAENRADRCYFTTLELFKSPRLYFIVSACIKTLGPTQRTLWTSVYCMADSVVGLSDPLLDLGWSNCVTGPAPKASLQL